MKEEQERCAPFPAPHEIHYRISMDVPFLEVLVGEPHKECMAVVQFGGQPG